jgi:hypothetical protein
MHYSSLSMSFIFSLALCLGGAAQAGGLSSVNSASWLAKKSDSGTYKPRKSRAAKKGKGNITFSDGSAESRSERDRRLSRECKGRSNSGVCEGYTR